MPSGLLFERRSVPREALFYQKLAEIARDAREQIRAILSRGGQDLIDASVQMKDAIGIGRGVLNYRVGAPASRGASPHQPLGHAVDEEARRPGTRSDPGRRWPRTPPPLSSNVKCDWLSSHALAKVATRRLGICAPAIQAEYDAWESHSVIRSLGSCLLGLPEGHSVT